VLDGSVAVVDATPSDNASGAENQQERFSIDVDGKNPQRLYAEL
jgi:hypothetical protein